MSKIKKMLDTDLVSELQSQITDLRSELAAWREIVVNLTRCEHGRVQGDNCFGCPSGWSPSQEGRGVGFSLDGTFRITVPPRSQMADPKAWYKES